MEGLSGHVGLWTYSENAPFGVSSVEKGLHCSPGHCATPGKGISSGEQGRRDAPGAQVSQTGGFFALDKTAKTHEGAFLRAFLPMLMQKRRTQCKQKSVRGGRIVSHGSEPPHKFAKRHADNLPAAQRPTHAAAYSRFVASASMVASATKASMVPSSLTCLMMPFKYSIHSVSPFWMQRELPGPE